MQETQKVQDTGLRCPSCGYNLTALTSSTCPECGREFALKEPAVRNTGPHWLKVLLFIGALFTTVGSLDRGNSAGGAACGLWIAFAILEVWGRGGGIRSQ